MKALSLINASGVGVSNSVSTRFTKDCKALSSYLSMCYNFHLICLMSCQTYQTSKIVSQAKIK